MRLILNDQELIRFDSDSRTVRAAVRPHPGDPMPRRLPLPSAIVLLLALGACGREPSEPGPGASSAADSAGPTATTAARTATPIDSVIAWAEDIRSGIAPLAGRVGGDPEGARQRAVELYITRQERIEQTVGPGTGSGDALERSVHEAEARFHDLMQILGTTPPPDSTSVEAAVSALDRELIRVLDLVPAHAAGAAGGAR
jgi:hypothetical protein